MIDHLRNAAHLYRDGRFDEAMEELRILLESGSAPPLAYERMTDIHKIQLRLDQGEQFFRGLQVNYPADGWVLIELARIRFLKGLPLSALRLLHDANRSFEQSHDELGSAYVAYYQLFINAMTGDVRNAANELAAIRSQFEKVGDDRGVARCHILAGNLREFLGDYAGAKDEYLLALTTVERMGDLDRMAALYLDLANCDHRTGRVEDARRHVLHARGLAHQLQSKLLMIYVLTQFASIEQLAENYEPARAALTDALAIAESFHFDYGRCDVLIQLGKLELSTGNLSQASATLTMVHQMALAINDTQLILEAATALLQSLIAEQEYDNAANVAQTAAGLLIDITAGIPDATMREAVINAHSSLIHIIKGIFQRLERTDGLRWLDQAFPEALLDGRA